MNNQMRKRLQKLLSSAPSLYENGKITFFAPSKTFGGDPMENWISEVALLAYGHKPNKKQICRDIKD